MLSLPVCQDGTEPVVKDVHPGDSVHSLLSILDVITVSSTLPPSGRSLHLELSPRLHPTYGDPVLSPPSSGLPRPLQDGSRPCGHALHNPAVAGVGLRVGLQEVP